MTETVRDGDKRAAAEAAVAEVDDGMCVGLGTGSTAAFAIAAIARRVREGLRIEAVATSLASERQARTLGIAVRDFDTLATLDLTIDGADEIDPRLFAIKGAGGAMVREKIVAAASTRMVVVADAGKRVAAIGAAALPVELLPFARAFVTARLEVLGARVALRRDGAETWRSDNGNVIADCRFGTIADPERLAATLSKIPGVVGHGLFLTEVDAAYVADGGAVTKLERPRGSG